MAIHSQQPTEHNRAPRRPDGSSRSISAPIHRAGTLLLVGGVTVAQLVWVALLGYELFGSGGSSRFRSRWVGDGESGGAGERAE